MFRSSSNQVESEKVKQDDEEIEEDIVQDHEDILLQQNSARDAIGTSGGAASSSAVGIDQSIDTLKLDEFDYVEEVKITPRGGQD